MENIDVRTATLQELADHLNRVEKARVELKETTLHFTGFNEKGICPSVSNIDLISRWSMAHGGSTSLLCSGDEVKVPVCVEHDTETEPNTLNGYIEDRLLDKSFMGLVGHVLGFYSDIMETQQQNLQWAEEVENHHKGRRSEYRPNRKHHLLPSDEQPSGDEERYIFKTYIPEGNYFFGKRAEGQHYKGFYVSPDTLTYIEDKSIFGDGEPIELPTNNFAVIFLYDFLERDYNQQRGFFSSHSIEGRTLSVKALDEILPKEAPDREKNITLIGFSFKRAFTVVHNFITNKLWEK